MDAFSVSSSCRCFLTLFEINWVCTMTTCPPVHSSIRSFPSRIVARVKSSEAHTPFPVGPDLSVWVSSGGLKFRERRKFPPPWSTCSQVSRNDFVKEKSTHGSIHSISGFRGPEWRRSGSRHWSRDAVACPCRGTAQWVTGWRVVLA